MITLPRYLHSWIKEDLKQKMVFIAGPRQVGKTTLAHRLGEDEYSTFQYFNWDDFQDRPKIQKAQWDPKVKLIIFDEIHKFKNWKTLIKGLFDKYKTRFHFLVTGSARLDTYRRGGDSLMGRYHLYRLHPFSVAELLGNSHNSNAQSQPFQPLTHPTHPEAREKWDRLFQFGGFPEPLFSQNERTLRRWHHERLERIVREDIRDIETLRDISSIELLADMLPEKVGSKLSLNSLREDLNVAHKTINLWMEVLERFYYHFRIRPFTPQVRNSLKKEPKLYLWDWSAVENPAARLENIVASHLLKWTHFLEDVQGWNAELHYLGDTEGREVDFLISVDRKPWLAVEVKQTDTKPSTALLYFRKKLNIPLAYQVVNLPNTDHLEKEVRIMSVEQFLATLV